MVNQITAKLINEKGVVDLYNNDLHAELVDFAKAVANKIPGAFFTYWAVEDVNQLYLCLEGHPTPLGEIFIDKKHNHNTWEYQRAYGVRAYKQINVRGNKNDKLSTNMKVAVRNAAKYLTMRPIPKLAGVYVDYYRAIRNEYLSPITEKISASKNETFGHYAKNDVVEELLYLHSQGHTFKNTALQEKVANFRDNNRHFMEIVQDIPSAVECVISIANKQGDIVKFIVAEFIPMQKDDIITHWKFNADKHVRTYTKDELPDYIVDTIPMLSMVEDGDYLEGHGAKRNSYVYFVERRDELHV